MLSCPDARVALENDEVLSLLRFSVHLCARMLCVCPWLRIVLRFHLVKIVCIRFAICTQKKSLRKDASA